MTTITISGMSCAHCTGSVATLLRSIPGISDISVTLDPGQATFCGRARGGYGSGPRGHPEHRLQPGRLMFATLRKLLLLVLGLPFVFLRAAF